ncbi:chromate transporter [Dyadobacter sp. OTU695]|uniref:chromate transporter n=1 Tax=Dyadobacter sp. OTU695 TaxID=3043860 RepID=UPI00313E934B
MAVVTAITQQEEVWLFIILGLVYMIIKAPPKWIKKPTTSLSVVLVTATGFWDFDADKLWQLGAFFTEAGAFVFGSGLVIIPFLQAGVVGEMGWLNEQQFLDSVAVAMITHPALSSSLSGLSAF